MIDLICVSYSGLSTYKDCPSRFNRRYVLKEDGGVQPSRATAPAMFRGTDIHNSIEDFLLGKQDDIHEEVSQYYLQFMTQLKELGAKPELSWGFDRTWGLQEFDDVESCMIRGMFDAILPGDEEINIYEWKTGKLYDDHVWQRSLYGMAGLIMYPKAEKCKVTTVYLDQRDLRSTSYAQGMLNTYKWMWEKRINEVQPPQPYPMVPSFKCGGCPYSKKNGGNCPN